MKAAHSGTPPNTAVREGEVGHDRRQTAGIIYLLPPIRGGVTGEGVRDRKCHIKIKTINSPVTLKSPKQ